MIADLLKRRIFFLTIFIFEIIIISNDYIEVKHESFLWLRMLSIKKAAD